METALGVFGFFVVVALIVCGSIGNNIDDFRGNGK